MLTYIIGGIVVVVGILGVALLVFLSLRPRSHSKRTATLQSDLQNERELSDTIISAIDDGVMLLDNERIIRLFNPGAAAITGWSVEETVGLEYRSVFKFVSDKGVAIPTETNPIERGIGNVTPLRDNDSFISTKAGKIIPLSMSISPLAAVKGSPMGAAVVFRDITNERNEEKQRAEFISTASHEMRTPVAAIEGYLSLALNDKVAKIDSKARDYLEKAHASTTHLGQLFQDLLTAAKSEDGRLTNHPTAVEMGQFLEELVDNVRFSAEKKGMLVDYAVGTTSATPTPSSMSQKVVRPLYYVHVDSERIREVITNLFDNAVKYSDRGKITIGLTGDEKIVQLRIADTGQGIAAEDIPHLFQKFYRVDSTETRTIGGTGLGLFICRKIVELYNGRIWVESELGKGSTFYINLPRLSTAQANAILANQSAAPLNI